MSEDGRAPEMPRCSTQKSGRYPKANEAYSDLDIADPHLVSCGSPVEFIPVTCSHSYECERITEKVHIYERGARISSMVL